MPNRAERRAAERAALKASRLNAQATISQPAEQAFAAGAAEPFGIAEPAHTPEPAASQAQINANRQNAQHSTGPTSEAGKAKVSQNRRTHGLTTAGTFFFLSTEITSQYEALADSVYKEYNPQTDTEARLADSLIRHYWLMQRAINYQNLSFNDEKKLSLYLRYQATHERAYYKAQKELIQLQKDRAKAQIGFESQIAKTRLANARAENLEVDTACQKVMEAPLPGNYRISFKEIAHACSIAISTLVSQQQEQAQTQTA